MRLDEPTPSTAWPPAPRGRLVGRGGARRWPARCCARCGPSGTSEPRGRPGGPRARRSPARSAPGPSPQSTSDDREPTTAGTSEPPGDGQVGAQVPPPPGPRPAPGRLPREPAPHRRPVVRRWRRQRPRGRPPPPPRGRGAPNSRRGPDAVISSTASSSSFPTSRLASRMASGSQGPAGGTPRAATARASAVLHGGEEPGVDDLDGAPRPGGEGLSPAGAASRSGRPRTVAGEAGASRTLVAGPQPGEGRGLRVEEPERSPADHPPSSRGGLRVDAGEAAGEGDRSGRHRGARRRPPADGGEGVGQADEVGEPGGEADEGHLQFGPAQELDHAVLVRAGQRGHLAEVGAVEDGRHFDWVRSPRTTPVRRGPRMPGPRRTATTTTTSASASPVDALDPGDAGAGGSRWTTTVDMPTVASRRPRGARPSATAASTAPARPVGGGQIVEGHEPGAVSEGDRRRRACRLSRRPGGGRRWRRRGR